jgi:hypothetical protein
MADSYNHHEPYPLRECHSWHDLTRLADEAGSHFFDTDTMRFFASRLLSGPYLVEQSDDRLTATYVGVTSEKAGFEDRTREYRVRLFKFSSRTAVRDDGRTIDLVELLIDDVENDGDGFGIRYSLSRTANNVLQQHRRSLDEIR